MKSILAILMLFGLPACAPAEIQPVMDTTPSNEVTEEAQPEPSSAVAGQTERDLPQISPGETAAGKSVYTDANGDTVIIPAQFTVSAKKDEQTVQTGLVVIGPDGSEFVWVSTTQPDSRAWIRITGMAEECDDAALRKKMYEENPILQKHHSSPEAEHFLMFRVKVENVELR